tara:strand:+ start:19904 stop:20878 length:975 start_codon:yes stop_codon:yes gene_type:complete
MAQEHNDEVDLVYVIKKIKEIIKGWVVLLFKAISFALKFWFVILALIIIGFGLGYYQIKDSKPARKATVIARVNYDLQPYVMTALDLYNSKSATKDSTFFTNLGFNRWNPQIKTVEALPIVDFKDILEEYQINERGLEMIVRYMEFDEEESLTDVLERKYNYFEFDFSLTSSATPADVEKFFDYINNDPQLAPFKQEALKNMDEQIAHNTTSLDLIDGVMRSYAITKEGAATTNNANSPFDLNSLSLLEFKLIIQDRNEKLKNEKVLSDEILKPVHEIRTRDAQGRFLQKKHIIYPFVLVFIFFLLAYIRYVYLYLRDVARQNS